MTHKENLEVVKELLKENYTYSEGLSIPLREDLTFDNTYKIINNAVVVYLDMRGSKQVMFNQNEYRSLKTHRAFLQSFISCIDIQSGKFRSFNGDGALAFFHGSDATSRAVVACMQFNTYMLKVNEILFERGMLKVDYGIGISRGSVYVAKTGKKGGDLTRQDLVWVGKPTYEAVELSDMGSGYKHIWITKNVYDLIRVQDASSQYNILTANDNVTSIWTKQDVKYENGDIRPAYYTTYHFTEIFN